MKTHTLCVLSRLLVDRSVANDCRLVHTIEAIVTIILETMEGENKTNVSNPDFRNHRSSG